MLAPTIFDQLNIISIVIIVVVGCLGGLVATKYPRFNRGLITNILVAVIGATLVAILGLLWGVNIKMILAGLNIGVAPLAICGTVLAIIISGLTNGIKS